jgi:hypothetical protein
MQGNGSKMIPNRSTFYIIPEVTVSGLNRKPMKRFEYEYPPRNPAKNCGAIEKFYPPAGTASNAPLISFFVKLCVFVFFVSIDFVRIDFDSCWIIFRLFFFRPLITEPSVPPW